jgi:hypothetical protein
VPFNPIVCLLKVPFCREKEDNLHSPQRKIVILEIKLHTIPLGLNNVLVGSGTLVKIDATPGILTAVHVITVSGWNNSIGVKQALVTTADRHASFFWERS